MTLAHGNQEHAKELRELVKISAYRTIEQDPAFGIRQIVDVALKALSPAINDTTTAVMCIDYLGAILAVVAPKIFPPLGLCRDARLRVLTIRPDFAALVREPFDQIRRWGRRQPGHYRPDEQHHRGDRQPDEGTRALARTGRTARLARRTERANRGRAVRTRCRTQPDRGHTRRAGTQHPFCNGLSLTLP